jgi:hypothetical protein
MAEASVSCSYTELDDGIKRCASLSDQLSTLNYRLSTLDTWGCILQLCTPDDVVQCPSAGYT